MRLPERRFVGVLLLLILAIYAIEAHTRRQERSSPATLGDQSAYLGYARHLYESNYTVVEDRNRMPVYPFLLSLIYKPGMTEDEFLVRAQSFTVNLSIVLLLLLFFILLRFFPPLMAAALVAATGFGVLLYRAGKAQAEPLFYFISFFGFVLLLWLFVRPRWWIAGLAGVVLGIAHLTKASVVPALGIWVVVFGLQILWHWRADGPRRLPLLALTVAAFFAVVFPYIQTSKRIYDAYFYNVNSTFVIWCDSSTEAYEFLSAHGDKDQWRALPPEQLPSFRKYWREHSIGQMVRRIVNGSLDLITRNLRFIGHYKFVLAIAVAALFFAVRRRSEARAVFAAHPFAAAFCLLFFAAYFLLYAWYDKVSNDLRFVLSMFLPFVFAGSLFIVRIGRGWSIRFGQRRFAFERSFAALLFGLAAIDVIYSATTLFR